LPESLRHDAGNLVGDQPVSATDLIPPPPLSEGGAGDTAPAAHLSGVTALSVELDPATPCFRGMIHGAKLHLETTLGKTR
jgi:hypothetical protein